MTVSPTRQAILQHGGMSTVQLVTMLVMNTAMHPRLSIASPNHTGGEFMRKAITSTLHDMRLLALSLILMSCGQLVAVPVPVADTYISEDLSRTSFASGSISCLTDDGCPTIRCKCGDASHFEVSACLLYSCMDKTAEYCDVQCASHNGPAGSQQLLDPPCATTPDRPTCLACRKAVAEAAQKDSCSAETDALRECLTLLDATRGLLAGVRSQDWWQDEVPCKSERDPYLTCLKPVDRALRKCADDAREHYEPFRPIVPEPSSANMSTDGN